MVPSHILVRRLTETALVTVVIVLAWIAWLRAS